MAQPEFRIPKQTDRSLLTALAAIRDAVKPLCQLVIEIKAHTGASDVELPDGDPTEANNVKYVLDEEAQVMPTLCLVGKNQQGNNHKLLTITRNPGQITDQFSVNWDLFSNLRGIEENNRSPLYVRLVALGRKHLRADDVESSLSGGTDSEWSRYRDAQQAILQSLEEAQKTILVDTSRRLIKAETDAQEKLESSESRLQAKYQTLEAELTKENAKRLEILEQQEKQLVARQESFNTKEARYVARQQQQDQIDQIKKWLEEWSLTAGTRNKRWSVVAAYAFGIVATGVLAVSFSVQNYNLLGAQDWTKIPWWQWLILSAKAIIPFAAFTTFIVYFIRWSSAWARQHAEEEFRNRARVLDIGRATWLLEAVRDAHDNQKELPTELLKELSRNLFSHSNVFDSGDIHPNAIGDLVMQGLSSIRVKSPDGTEFEATRNKKS